MALLDHPVHLGHRHRIEPVTQECHHILVYSPLSADDGWEHAPNCWGKLHEDAWAEGMPSILELLIIFTLGLLSKSHAGIAFKSFRQEGVVVPHAAYLSSSVSLAAFGQVASWWSTTLWIVALYLDLHHSNWSPEEDRNGEERQHRWQGPFH